MEPSKLLRLTLFVNAMEQDLLSRARIATESGKHELAKNHLHNRAVAREILLDLAELEQR